MPLLVRTPAPFKNESLFGYVLRVSEANGYDTPWHVFKLAGMAQGEMRSPSISAEKLATILNRDPSDLAELTYVTSETPRSFKLLNHNLGRTPRVHFLRLRHPAFCPYCVQEKGYIEAFWDLKAAIACPEHHCAPICHCPECRMAINLFRPGLLRCQCGASLAAAGSIALSASISELMGLLKAKLEDIPLVEQSNITGLPIEALEPIPLLVMMGTLESLGHQILYNRGFEAPGLDASISAAADALADWPRNYNRVLAEIGHRLAENGLHAFGLRKQFNLFYSNIFRRKLLGSKTQFLKDEFIRFGLQHWDSGTVDIAKFRWDTPSEARYISKATYSARHSLSKLKFAQMTADGTIAQKTIQIGKRTRVLVDLYKTRPPIDSQGRLGIRDAAKRLELPISALIHLRDCGFFVKKPRTGRRDTWHADDLDEFLQRGLALAANRQPHGSTVAVSELMRLKMRDRAAKGDIIAALFDGRLTVRGHLGKGMGGLLLDQMEVDTFIREKRQSIEDDTLSLRDAAKLTGLSDSTVVVPAARLGLLEVSIHEKRTRISAASIAKFSETYVPLKMLAKDLGILCPFLWRFCQQNGFETIAVPRPKSRPPMPLLPIAMKKAVIASWKLARQTEERRKCQSSALFPPK